MLPIRTRLRPIAGAIIFALLAAPGLSQEMTLDVELPRLKVAEYHNPYVAAWLQDDQGQVINLNVWYDVAMENQEGEKWLKDMRLWWRRTGRTLQLPLDGVTGATRAPGTHTLRFRRNEPPLQALKPGQYQLLVEAAREVGGRETVNIPFAWPPQNAQQLSASGSRELGRISLQLAP